MKKFFNNIFSFILRLVKRLIVLCTIFVVIILSISQYIVNSNSDRIFLNGDVEEVKAASKNYQAAFILGCAVYGNKPSMMLKDRLDAGIELYKKGVVPKLVMTGDNGSKWYDEVNVMKKYAIDKGVKSSDIFMDHAGFSTYESMFRAKNIFDAENIIVVTQKYHLHRAIYLANKMDSLDAIGYTAPIVKYSDYWHNNIREILARNKDFVFSFINPKSKVGGEKISLKDNGDITNDWTDKSFRQI